MKVLGLTGGIGMGKSTATGLLRERSIAVVDTDDLAREVVAPGEPALAEVGAIFGPEIIDPDGRLNRGALARRVFSDAAARQKLEAILHPRIRDRWRAQVNAWRAENRALAVVVIPLLFETHAENEFDQTICAACSAGTQRERLLARGWPPEQIKQRIEAQLPIAQKLEKADFVIWTEPVGLETHAAQWDRVLAAVQGRLPH
jgi:dephospho-CoA kinase